MIVLVLLLGSFAALTAVERLAWGRPSLDARLRGRISLAVVFLFTGGSHFFLTEPMARMLPELVPLRREIVLATGVLEFVLASGLLWRRTSRAAGIAAMLFLVAVFPANVYAAVNRVPIGGSDAGPVYLWFRAPLQVMLIVWSYWCTRSPGRKTADAVQAAHDGSNGRRR